MKFTAATVAGLSIFTSIANAAPVSENRLEARQNFALNAITTIYMFTYPLPAFLEKQRARDPPGLDWSNDGCSNAPDKPLGFNFLDSCLRHDFGYRNYKRQNRWTDANRLAIDNQFKKDLLAHCEEYSSIRQATCTGLANLYYEAVRRAGDGLDWDVEIDSIENVKRDMEIAEELAARGIELDVDEE